MYAHLLSATHVEQNLTDGQVLLSVQVEFGVPSDNDCVKFGICRTIIKEKVQLPVPRKRHSCRSAPACLSQPMPDQLLFQFPLSLIRPCTKRVFFNTGIFVMEVPYILTDALVQALHLTTAQYWIPAGGFNLCADTTQISLFLPLMQQNTACESLNISKTNL